MNNDKKDKAPDEAENLNQLAEELDEKLELKQESIDKNEVEDSLQDFESNGEQETANKTTERCEGESAENEVDLQHIFNQFDNNTNTESDKRSSQEAMDEGASASLPVEEPTTTPSDASQQKDRPALPPKGIRKHSADTPNAETIPFDFNRFLEQMRRRNAHPITRYFKSFLQSFERRPWTVNEQSKIIRDFLDFIYVKMRDCEVWKYASEQEFENAKEGMEKLVMNRLYQVTFSPKTTDDKERDEVLFQKISIFRWISEEHLDIPVTEHNEPFLKFARSELLNINNYKAPRDKLICILNCCKVIFGLIKHVEGDAGADKFLPILIYVVIRANPPKLVSNVQYISRFRNPDQLQSEAGYYLTNLMGAITFIETMEAKSLSITQEEFDANIEETIRELEKERPSPSPDKPMINYEDAVYPLQRPQAQSPPLIDPVKAAALLEKGSNFAQKTMQKPLNFVGKIFQGLGETSPAESSAVEQQPGRPYRDSRVPQAPPQIHGYSPPPGSGYGAPPTLPPRRSSSQKAFDENLTMIRAMFPNVEPEVCFMILQASGGAVSQTIDTLLEISNPKSQNDDADLTDLVPEIHPPPPPSPPERGTDHPTQTSPSPTHPTTHAQTAEHNDQRDANKENDESDLIEM